MSSVTATATITDRGQPSIRIVTDGAGLIGARLSVNVIRMDAGRVNPKTKVRKPREYIERKFARVIGPFHSEVALLSEVNAWIAAQPIEDQADWRLELARARTER